MAENVFQVDASITETHALKNEELFGSSFGVEAGDLEEINEDEEKEKAKKAKLEAEAKAKAEKEAKERKVAEVKTPAKEEEKTDSGQEAVSEFFKDEEEVVKAVTKATESTETGEETQTEGEGEVNKFKDLSEELYRLDIFRPDVDEDGNESTQTASTPEEFKNLFETQSNNKGIAWVNNFLSKFGEDRQALFDAVFVQGVDLQTYLPAYNQATSMKELTLEDEASQEKVIREFYKRAGIPDEKVNKKIQMLKDSAYLMDEAETLHPQLIQQDEQALEAQRVAAETKQANEQRADGELKNSIVKILKEKITAKEFDGIPVNDKVATQVFDFMYTKKYKTPDNKLLTELDKWILELNRPENHATKVKLGLLAQSNLDLSKVQTKAITNKSEALFSKLTQTEAKKSNKAKIAPPEDTWGKVLNK